MKSETIAVLEPLTAGANLHAAARKRALVLRLLTPLMIVGVLVFALPILSFPPGRDQGTYLQIGQSLLDGKHLYIDAWDNKPPAIFYFYAVIAKIFGRVMWSVALVDILLLFAISYLLFRFVERYLGPVGATIAVVLHACWHSEMFYFWIAQPETFQVLCVLVSCLLLMQGGNWKVRSFAAGLVCGVGFWLKYNFLAFLPLALLLPFLDEKALDRQIPQLVLTLRWRDWLDRAAHVVAGFGLSIVIVLIAIAVTGGLPAMREAQLQVLPRYAAMAITHNPHYLMMAISRTYLCLGVHTLLAILVSVVVGWLSRDLKRFFPIFLTLAVALIAVVMQVRFHTYYFQSCFPFIAAIWAYLALRLYEATRELGAILKSRRQKLAAVLVWVVFANLVFWPVPPHAIELFLRYEQLSQWHDDRETFYANYPDQISIELLHGQLDVVHYIQQNTKPDDSIYLWGSNSLIYFLSGRRCPTRFVLNLGVLARWGEPSWKDEVMNGIEKAKPALIVVTQGDALPTITYVDKDSEEYLHSEFARLDDYILRHYTKANQFDGFVVYRRNP